jgi:hypothetical protein
VAVAPLWPQLARRRARPLMVGRGAWWRATLVAIDRPHLGHQVEDENIELKAGPRARDRRRR